MVLISSLYLFRDARSWPDKVHDAWMLRGLAPGWPLTWPLAWPLAWPWLALGLALGWPLAWPLAWPWLAWEHPKDHQSSMPSAGVRSLQNGSYAASLDSQEML